MTAKEEVQRQLQARGYAVARIIRLESAGDSASHAQEVLFVTPKGKACCAYLTREPGVTPRPPIINVVEGWPVD